MIHRNTYILLAMPIIMGVMFFTIPSSFAVATIKINNNDGPGEGFNDPALFTPVGGNSATTIGEARLIAFQFAADVWGSYLNSKVPIQVDAQLNPLPCNAFSAVIGQAGTTTIHRDFPNAPVPNTWYPQALANSLADVDLYSSYSDIAATFNSNIDNNNACLNESNWYYGLDENPPAGDIDFVTVVLHELAHGLGFQSFVRLGTGAKLFGFDDTYMLNLEHHGATPDMYPNMSNTQRVTASMSDPNLHWLGSNVLTEAASIPLTGGFPGGHVRMHGPNPQQRGSSVSHFSTAVFPDEIMEPVYTGPNHDVGLALPLMKDIGWSDKPLLIDLDSFTATAKTRGTYVTWKMANERGVVGFDLWRGIAENGKCTANPANYSRTEKLTATNLIYTKGVNGKGASYEFEDDFFPNDMILYCYGLVEYYDTGEYEFYVTERVVESTQ